MAFFRYPRSMHHLQREAQVCWRCLLFGQQALCSLLYEGEQPREGHIHALDRVGQLQIFRALLCQLLYVISCRAGEPSQRVDS